MRLFRQVLLFVILISTSLGHAQLACEVAYAESADQQEEPITLSESQAAVLPALPNIVQNLSIVFPSQERMLRGRNKSYLAFKATQEQMASEIYKKFQRESIELILSGGAGGFRHLLLRVGDKVYDFGSVRMARAGVHFIRPSESKDYKGVAFIVGHEKIAQAEQALIAFYRGSNLYNNPPYSATGGQLAIVDDGNGTFRFKSNEGKPFLRGAKVDTSTFLNNQPFVGKIVEDVQPNGRTKLVLENPMGSKIPVSVSEKGFQYVNGFSCASSAVFALKNFFGMEVFPSVSAANLIKTILDGHQGYDVLPDALVLYGPERWEPKVAFKEPSFDLSLAKADGIEEETPVVQRAAEENAPVAAQPAVEPNTVEENPPVVAAETTAGTNVTQITAPATSQSLLVPDADLPENNSPPPKKSAWRRFLDFFR